MRFDLLATSDLWFTAQGVLTKTFDKIESTTIIAKNEASQMTVPLAVYITNFQTAGRGRGTNTWQAKSGDAFLASWSFALDKGPQPIIAPLVGLALLEAASAVWPKLNFSLKAPNDIYLNDKKLIGILVEAVEGKSTRVIVSFGFNVFGSPAEVPTATSLLASHPDATSSEWKKFLSQAFIKLKNAVVAGTETTLALEACDKLCKALNSNPNLLEKFSSVEPDGSLRSAKGLTRWQDL